MQMATASMTSVRTGVQPAFSHLTRTQLQQGTAFAHQNVQVPGSMLMGGGMGSLRLQQSAKYLHTDPTSQYQQNRQVQSSGSNVTNKLLGYLKSALAWIRSKLSNLYTWIVGLFQKSPVVAMAILAVVAFVIYRVVI